MLAERILERIEHGHALERYRERVHRALSQQDDDRLTQRAVLASMASIYDAALQQLEQLPLSTAHLAVEQGRCALTPRVLEPFTGLADQLLADAMIRAGRVRTALVVVGTNWTRHVDYHTPQAISAVRPIIGAAKPIPAPTRATSATTATTNTASSMSWLHRSARCQLLPSSRPAMIQMLFHSRLPAVV